MPVYGITDVSSSNKSDISRAIRFKTSPTSVRFEHNSLCFWKFETVIKVASFTLFYLRIVRAQIQHCQCQASRQLITHHQFIARFQNYNHTPNLADTWPRLTTCDLVERDSLECDIVAETKGINIFHMQALRLDLYPSLDAVVVDLVTQRDRGYSCLSFIARSRYISSYVVLKS